MSDLISRQGVIKAIDKFIPADPMKSDYTQGISVGLAIATLCVERFSQENAESSQGLVKDLISRQAAIDAIHEDADWLASQGSDWQVERMERDKSILMSLPSAEPKTPSNGSITSMKPKKMHVRTTDDLISRQDAVDIG